MEELPIDLFKVIVDDIPLVSLLSLKMMSRRLNALVTAVLTDDKHQWALRSLKRFLEPKLNGVSFEHFCSVLQQGEAVLSGSTLLQWAIGEDYHSDVDIFRARVARLDGQSFLVEDQFYEDFKEMFGARLNSTQTPSTYGNYEYMMWTQSIKGCTGWEFFVDNYANGIQLIHHVADARQTKEHLQYVGAAKDSLTLGPSPLDPSRNTIVGIVVHTFDFELLKNVFDGRTIYFHHFGDIFNRRLRQSPARPFTPQSRVNKYISRGFSKKRKHTI